MCRNQGKRQTERRKKCAVLRPDLAVRTYPFERCALSWLVSSHCPRLFTVRSEHRSYSRSDLAILSPFNLISSLYTA